MDNLCPICNEEPEMTCRCFMADSICKNKHEWHTCVTHGVKVLGRGDHTGNTFKCTCNNVENDRNRIKG